MHIVLTPEELNLEKAQATSQEYKNLRCIIESNGEIPVEFTKQEVETDDVFVVKTLLKLLKPEPIKPAIIDVVKE
jgi:hypothetical protein